MSGFVKVPLSCCDEIVVAKLKEDIKTVRSVVETSTNPIDISDHKKYLKGLKRVLKYYGG